MSPHLQNIANAITSAAGWKSASPDENGIFRFSVENGLDFQLLTPEGRTAVLLADLGAAPAQGDTQGDEELKRLASVAAASLKKRRSSFAVAGSRLELSRTFPMLAEEQEIRLIVRDFLNDLAWWQAQMNGARANSSSSTSSSPFSLGGWFSGF